MLNDKLEILLSYLQDKEYHTARELSEKLQVSTKTIRIRIKELNSYLLDYGAQVESKPKIGYWLEIHDEDKYRETDKQPEKDWIPTTSTERVSYILAYLLNRDEYIKMEDLADFLYISRNTLSADLKKVEYIFNMYDLELERRPNYGVRVIGKEFDKRICIANNLINRNFMRDNGKIQQELYDLGNSVLTTIQQFHIKLSEVSFDSLVTHVYITIKRIRRRAQVEIDNDKVEELVGEQIMQATRLLVEVLEQKEDITFEANDISYLALHLASKTSSDFFGKYGTNTVISSQIDHLSLQMIETVFKGFTLDFRDNLELRMSLNQHMVPLDIRLKYNIPLKNPLLDEVKKQYAFAYTIAASACTVLNDYYQVDMTEDEIGYFAMIFGLALEKQDKTIDKKNIVVVCASGKGTTQLFIYRYKQAFGKYIDHMYECTTYELETFDFKGKKIDYVFTTIPIYNKLPVPIFEVNIFLEKDDILTYRDIFEQGDTTTLNHFYKKELFFTEIHGESKEKVIQQLCDLTSEFYDLPPDFYDAVMKREQLGQTDFGNLAAIPHPMYTITKESMVTVGVLDEPIWWGHNDVQVVFLIAISKEEDVDIENFYQMTTQLLFDGESLQYLIKHPTFNVLMDLLGNQASNN